jgi:peptidoglycan/LPS O-acetylase OafA/YrhL
MAKNPLIQSLRGISVAMVVFFHIGIPAFRNGWVGVDVFFVISGFLMWRLYESSILEGKIWHFYSKRLQRLLPGLLVTLVFFGIAFWVTVLPFERQILARELLGSITASSNFIYWAGDEYFSNGSFRPFLNMWSIACEMQFYLLFPLIIFWIRRDARKLIFLFCVSFLVAFALTGIHPPSGFFLLPGRFWEFLLGGLAATYPSKKLNPMYKLRREHLVFFGMFFFGALQFRMSVLSQEIFRSIIVLFTAFLLRLPSKQVSGNYLTRPMIFIGDYSYSIYLIHYPLIAFLGYEPFMGFLEIAKSARIVLLFSVFLILGSWLNRKFVEGSTLFRNNAFRVHVVGIFLISFLVYFQPKIENVGYSVTEVSISNAMSDRDPFRCGLILRIAFTNQPYKSCRISNNPYSSDNALLVGNSHADAIKGAVAASIPDYDLYLLNENNALRPDTLQTYVKGVLRINPKLVILHSSPGSVNLKSLEQFGIFLKKKNIPFFVIAPIPQPQMNVPQYLFMNIKNHSRVINSTDPDFSIETYYNQNRSELVALDRLSSSLNIHVIATVDLFCLPFCQILDENSLKPLYFDTSHLTKTGASKLITRIRTAIG